MFDDYLDQGRFPPIRVAKLLFQAAGQGDEAAIAVLRRQGEELGKSAKAVIHRLGMEGDSFDVVLAGSIITRGEGNFVHAYIEQAVNEVAPGARIAKLRVEPVVGAVWLAVEASGIALPEPMYARLSTLGEYSLA
jgi:N-acetylglucosamine kinase-like BadF-type ATPase